MSDKYLVERTDWFGDREVIESGLSIQQAKVLVAKLKKTSASCDDPADKVRYVISPDTFISETNNQRAALA